MKLLRILPICLLIVLPAGAVYSSGLPFAPPRDSLNLSGRQLTGKIFLLNNSNPRLNEFNIWAGHAFDSWRLWGKTPDATLSQLGLRYNRKFLRVNEHIIEYVVEADLYTHYSYPAYEPRSGRIKLSGFGLVPVGFQMNFFGNSTIQPFLKTTGGLMFLDGPFPDERGTKFNFTYDAGGGLEFLVSEDASFSLGFRFYHLSNWFTGQVNPGVDSSFFYFGITVF